MKINTCLALAILSAVAAVAVPAGVAEMEHRSPLDTCSWTGYGRTGFQDSYGSTGGSFGACYAMPNSNWVKYLFSAKAGTSSGGKVCLATSSNCGGSQQTIDTAGYRDMTNLPAYHSWRCGAC